MRLLSHRPAICLLVLFSFGSALVAAAPKLVVKDRVHDFGAIDRGKALEATLEFSNAGDAVLHVLELSPSCGCTTTGDWPHELAPGAKASVPVKVDTAHFNGQIGKTVLLRTDDPTEGEIYFELRAKITTPISIATSVLIFPAVSDPNQSLARSTTLRNETDEPLKLTTPVSDNPLFRPELKTIIPDKEYELVVTTGTPLPEGTQSARITMGSTVSKMPKITIEAVITLLAPVQIAPTQITLTAPKLAAPEKRFAVIMSHRGADLQLSDVATDAPGAQLTTALSPDRKQATITVTFPAGFEMKPDSQFVLRGKTNQPSAPTFEVPIVYAGPR
jgi:hypothetical protein